MTERVCVQTSALLRAPGLEEQFVQLVPTASSDHLRLPVWRCALAASRYEQDVPTLSFMLPPPTTLPQKMLTAPECAKNNFILIFQKYNCFLCVICCLNTLSSSGKIIQAPRDSHQCRVLPFYLSEVKRIWLILARGREANSFSRRAPTPHVDSETHRSSTHRSGVCRFCSG